MKTPHVASRIAWRFAASAVVLVAATFGAMPAFAAGAVEAAASRPDAIQPNALLTIDQNRTTVVDRIVTTWGDPLASSGAGITRDQLHALLGSLRSDQLLAASLAGSLEGLRNVIANTLTANAPVAAGLINPKTLGDAAADLVYTPVTPCRLADTRLAGGPIVANASRDFKVWVAGGGFTAQGGDAGNCAIPANPAAVALNLTVVNPSGLGNLIAYPTGAAVPNASTLNYQNGTVVLANGAIIPACTPGCANQITVKANGPATDLVIDIVGYFKSPGLPVGTVSSPQIARWDGFVEPIPSTGNASIWTFAGGTATVTIAPGPARRLTAYGVAAMAVSNGTQRAAVNICYQNQNGPKSVTEFRPASFMSLPFSTTVSSYTSGDSVVLPSGTYKVGMCVNNNEGPIAIDANDYSHGWVMTTSD